ncbi:NPC intracellular cholesterol transporter 2 homolog a [Nomia melanderi]|uniref:NPC intracellular cholesterol transporter 2 homolog a n=1 Tax=Nomia melanderi TaxID=2448451 RepID=UPI001304288E|nr:NPC intracellular cholesterol transporter 2 homolog a-like [Nomia melanderi]XP_031839662.1 NPC intracellular cholesterol transporter 2 homolog a-like [Nomia melanderi]XP_031839666.1 NPC intracellular cholesterol transporter 2 homolog a-like [Nomia melanderi]XP_031839672.1 NPC intracellular cholesterol transporter 2 homolog a-like [Nomia melanderi]
MRPTIAPLLLLFCFALSPTCRAFEVIDCGSKVGTFTSVTLSGCDMTKQACDLIRDTNATIEIDFTVDKEITNMYAIVHGVIMDVPIGFPLPNANACEYAHSGITCPVAKGTACHYTNTLPVLKSYPKLSLIVRWELRDENNQDIVCLLIPARIK